MELSEPTNGAYQSGSEIPEAGFNIQEALAPADGGRDAYLVLVASFILEGLVWGKCTALS